MKVLIIGGVAGGATAAARLRRLDEKAEIVVFERGKYISYANCGLPYHIGEVISQRDSLLVMPKDKFISRFNVDVRTQSDVIAIDRKTKQVSVKDLMSGKTYTKSYDKLIIATGSSPIIPQITGAELDGVERLWTVSDMDKIIAQVKNGVKKAVVVGGGFIGLEVAENLKQLGIDVTVVELMDQVLPTVDCDMSTMLEQELLREGINLKLGGKVDTMNRNREGTLNVNLSDGNSLTADMVVLSIGVKPNSELAQKANLKIGERGHIKVSSKMVTSDENILAVGDVIEVADPVFGGQVAIPLAGPANKQGRLAAEVVAGKETSSYKGTLVVSLVKVGGITAGSVGWTERRLKQAGHEYLKIYLHPASNASYYPGGAMMTLKLLFGAEGQILGCQGVGAKGVDKRIDVISTAMQGGLTVYDLAQLELGYAPPYGSAKDPVNLAGMIAANLLDKTTDVVHADNLSGYYVVDVREEPEYELGAIDNAVNIPLGQLRGRMNELPKDRKIAVYCQVGLRGYVAERMLKQNGFDAANISGGYLSWKMFNYQRKERPMENNIENELQIKTAASTADFKVKETLDLRSLQCPGPIVQMKQSCENIGEEESIKIMAQKTFTPDLYSWAKSNNMTVTLFEEEKSYISAVISKGASLAAIKTKAEVSSGKNGAIVLFSNDLDKAMAALIIACGMAAAGKQVGIFFTFWGLSVLRKEQHIPQKKDFSFKNVRSNVA